MDAFGHTPHIHDLLPRLQVLGLGFIFTISKGLLNGPVDHVGPAPLPGKAHALLVGDTALDVGSAVGDCSIHVSNGEANLQQAILHPRLKDPG